jgi:hypothetical protein
MNRANVYGLPDILMSVSPENEYIIDSKMNFMQIFPLLKFDNKTQSCKIDYTADFIPSSNFGIIMQNMIYNTKIPFTKAILNFDKIFENSKIGTQNSMLNLSSNFIIEDIVLNIPELQKINPIPARRNLSNICTRKLGETTSMDFTEEESESEDNGLA